MNSPKQETLQLLFKLLKDNVGDLLQIAWNFIHVLLLTYHGTLFKFFKKQVRYVLTNDIS